MTTMAPYSPTGLLANLPEVSVDVWRLAVDHRVALIGAPTDRIAWLRQQVEALDGPLIYDEMVAEGWQR